MDCKSVMHTYNDKSEVLSGISVITCSMNRTSRLSQSLFSWLQCKDISEIIIVDWSSIIPVFNEIKHLIDGSKPVTIIRVNDQKKWILSIAYNIAASFVKYSNILKLDSDNILHIDFFNNHKLSPYDKHFYSGNWKNARTDNEKHLNGVLYTKTIDYINIGGYNEYIQTYGWDDNDIYERLSNNGLTQRDLNNAYIYHIEHTDSDRSDLNLFRCIQTNRLLCSVPEGKWDKNCSKSKYMIKSIKKDTAQVVDITIENLTQVDPGLLKIISDKFEHTYTEKHSNKNVLYLCPRNGLGNRLRVLSSGYNLYKSLQHYHSKYFQWKLILIWIPDEHCNISFDKLFTIPNHKEDIIISSTKPILPNSYIIIQSDIVNSSQNIISPSNLVEMIDKSINPSLIWIESASVINTKYYNWVDDCRFLRQLTVSTPILTLIDQVNNSLANSLSFG